MDIRIRVLTARLAIRIDENKAFDERIRTKNTSHYRRHQIERRKKIC